MKKIPIEYMTGVKRYEDMSPSGYIRLLRQTDGDVIIQVTGKDPCDEEKTVAIEFCNIVCGGGQSLHTMNALIALIEAVKKDNEERPQERSFTESV